MKVAAVLFIAAALLLSGCALFPPDPDAMVDAATTRGCKIKSVDTNDSFAWKFLGISTSRRTSVSCHE